jgi:exopolyphosphatase / guanosine-5'-triphosphate,3'-diphosphate pyrophosphatase
VVADIGGGSTEIISAHDAVVQMARSLPLGSGRLTERFVAADPPHPDEIAACDS